MKRLLILLMLSILTACSNAANENTDPLPTAHVVISTPTNVPPTQINSPTSTSATESDFFTETGIILPAPSCSALTQQQTEGPYYTPNTPERNSLLEDGMQGTRLIVVGYVLDQNCRPLSNAWLDFWQADANGEYDNAGYTLRGHQFADSQGRYYLETIMPGLYSSRPIEHIHVKIQPESGAMVTTQLYFPVQPIEGLTVILEDRENFILAYFNFVIEK